MYIVVPDVSINHVVRPSSWDVVQALNDVQEHREQCRSCPEVAANPVRLEIRLAQR